MKTEIIDVSPDLAKYYLSKNTANRTVSKRHVIGLANQMKNGLWLLTHQAICFDIAGNLIDGQHRLHAIVKANMVIKMMVVTGADNQTFTVLDTGKNRNAADVLSIENVRNYTQVAACIRLWYKLRNGWFHDSGESALNATNQQVLTFYNERPDFWQNIIHETQKLYKSSLQLVTMQYISGIFAHWADNNQDVTFIKAVFENDDTVINARGLHKMLLNYKLKKRNVSLNETLRLFFKYHSYFMDGRSVKQFTLLDKEVVKTF